MMFILPRSIGCIHRFYTLQGLMPLKLLDYQIMKGVLNSDIRFDLYNVKYGLGMRNKGFRVLEKKGYLPRAKIYYNYVFEKDKEKALSLLNTVDFDYRNIIILNEHPYLDKAKSPGGEMVNITEYNENSITLLEVGILGRADIWILYFSGVCPKCPRNL